MGVLAPLGFVKVDGEKVAGVVRQERVDADRPLAGKVAIDDVILHWYQRTIVAFGALDSWLLTDAGTPFIGACGGIARLASGRAFPAHRMNIGASPEQAPKQRDLFRCREVRWLG